MKRVTGNNRPGLVTTAGHVTGQKNNESPKKEKTETKKRKPGAQNYKHKHCKVIFSAVGLLEATPHTDTQTHTHASTHM
jgi:hypothetical protein